MVDRIQVLTACFAIDVYAYAFMSNHYHLVLYVDPVRVNSWSDSQVIKKWRTLWNWRRPASEPAVAVNVSVETVKQWRLRLADVSWVMRLLNEPMARIANAEDGVTGHFWESRFKCNPLLDDPGLVTCMVYADLNPIKAGVALTPEASDFTSIKQRICQLVQKNVVCGDAKENDNARSVETGQSELRDRLLPVSCVSPDFAPVLSISLESYIELVESTAEAILESDSIRSTAALIALGINPSGWIRAVKEFVQLFRTAAGAETAFTEFMQMTGRTRRQDATARRLWLT